jgi:S1-C subfamily serine protease
MRENESEPGGRWETPERHSPVSNPWTQAQPDNNPDYPPPHYAANQWATHHRASDQWPTDQWPSGDQPEDDTVAVGNPPRYEPPAYGPPPGYGPPGYGPPPGYDLPAYGPPPPPRPSRAGRLLIYLVVAAVAAGIGAGATVVFNHSAAAPSTGVSHDEPAQHNNARGAGNLNLNENIVETRVDPGLVDITATLKYQSETAEGTGMVLTSNGLVLTNNHVIDNSTSVYASLVASGHTYRARVIGYDTTDDVALLQLVGASGLPTVSFGNSGQVNVGTPVLALGNAQGRGGVTPAAGVISALDRSINASDQGSGTTENLHGMQQTSAQIQQGDSGGALADKSGQVIGMITAANTTSSQPGGTVGFAIPINTALSIARQISGGRESNTVYIGDPGFLGVVLATSSSASPRREADDEQRYLMQHGAGGGGDIGRDGCVANSTDISDPARVAPAAAGALIIDVFCGTAADVAGMVAGDVITSVNGQAITTAGSLISLTGKYRPGAVLSIGWEDLSGHKHTTSIKLKTGPVR